MSGAQHGLPEDPPGLSDALLRWANTFEDLPHPVESWQDLQDGQAVWTILKNIEPDYFTGPLPEAANATAENWIPRWQNLKHIDRLIMAFIRDECGKLPELSKRMQPDLKAIAIDGNSDELLQILKACLLSAMYSPISNQRMVSVMQELGGKVAIPIAQCIGNLEALDAQLVAEADAQVDAGSDMEAIGSPDRALSPPTTSGLQRDPALESEEKLYHAYANVKELEERNTELISELNSMRGHIDELEDELTEAKYRLDHGGADTDNEILDQLRQKSVRDKDYIAELETELGNLKASTESQERQLGRLKGDEDGKQQMQDELQLLRVERDELLQKAKASENLKKKIQTLQESDKAGVQLREDYEAASEELQQLKPFKERCQRLQRANEENMKTIANVEQEIFDQKATRKRLDHEIKILSQRLEQARERSARDADTMAEQEEKIRELESGIGKSGLNPDSLDDEFASRDKLHNDLRSKISEMEREIAHLQDAERQSDDVGASSQLQQQLRERNQKLEKQYLDVYQENLGLESAVQDRSDGVLQSQPFIELRDRLHEEEQVRKRKEQRLFDAEAELGDLKVKLQAQESKLNSVGKEKIVALEEMKLSVGKEVSTAQAENSRLVQHVKAIETELDEHRSLLRHALLNKHALVREDSIIREKNEFKLVSEELKKFKGDPDSFYDVAASLTQRIEESRSIVAQKESDFAKVSPHSGILSLALTQRSWFRRSGLLAKRRKHSSRSFVHR